MSNDNKKLEIIQGDGKDLEISNVSKHLAISKPKPIDKSNKNIVIPEVKKLNKKEEKK